MTRNVKFWLGGAAALCIAQAACGSSGHAPGTGGATGTTSTSSGGGATSHGTGGSTSSSTSSSGMTSSSTSSSGMTSSSSSGSGGANACVPLGYHCQGGDTCCEGTCPPDGGGNCCNGAGGACDPSVINPDAFCCLGNTCDKAQGKCVPLTCIGPMYEGVCIALPGIPCCVAGTQCMPIVPGGGGGFHCCAPNGTELPESQSSLCCSNSTLFNGDGTVTCIE